MTADDRTETQWGVRYPNGTMRNATGDREWALNELDGVNGVLERAGSTERAVIVTRTRTITYTEWTVDE